MKYEDITGRFRFRPLFEARELDVVYDESYTQIRSRLSRWVAQGKLIQVRRGYYFLPPEVRAVEPSLYTISNILYSPSYISLHSALEYYGMIPERVEQVEAVTPRQTGRWRTPLGRFSYVSIKMEAFRGYRYLDSGSPGRDHHQQSFFVATPEKALLDLFYFQPGEWTVERINEMRFQPARPPQRGAGWEVGKLNKTRLGKLLAWFDSPRVTRATQRFLRVTELT